jgi:hypothetical protein
MALKYLKYEGVTSQTVQPATETNREPIQSCPHYKTPNFPGSLIMRLHYENCLWISLFFLSN